MAQVVLDASAVLALILSEPGAAQVEQVIADSLIAAINEAEILSRLIWGGESAARAEEIVEGLPYRVIDVDQRLARRAGTLWPETRAHGLSLGDRCCLALAEREGLPVLTSDSSWRNVAIGVEINLLGGRRRK